MSFSRLTLLVCWFVTASQAEFARAQSNSRCVLLPVQAIVREDNARHTLSFEITNTSEKPVSIEQSYFSANMLRLEAVSIGEGKRIPPAYLLISPGVLDINISPGEVAKREVELDLVFPDLAGELSKSDVGISWELVVKPINGCFLEKIMASIVLKGRLDR